MKKFTVFCLAVLAAVCYFAAESCQRPPEPVNRDLVGTWVFENKDGVMLKITESEINFLPVIPNPQPYDTRPYHWISNDSIEVTAHAWGIYVTRSKVIFHTADRVTLTGWFVGNAANDAPIYADVTLVRIGELVQTSEYWQAYPSMSDWEFNQVYIANSDAELAAHPVFLDNTVNCICPNDLLTPNWATQSVVITYGQAAHQICSIQSDFWETVVNGYDWNVIVFNNPNIIFGTAEWYIYAKTVPKIPSNAQITLQTDFYDCGQ
ncbi:MAG: hypothetical protein LBN95_09945 [Prevotellaceae bacterium]|jgi:hypothetical protein|nr:hypothetical protein [Prevotellaceae bacterium]